MSDLKTRCLDAFPEWLKSLPDDAMSLCRVLEDTAVPDRARRQVAGALSYLFKSLDLIPDGIEDLGFIDDALVFRVAAARASAVEGAGDADGSRALAPLAEDAELAREFLAEDAPRFESFVESLTQLTAKGRSVDDIIDDASVQSAFVGDVRGWAGAYTPPTFTRDEKNLVKLRSFLTTKLPS